MPTEKALFFIRKAYLDEAKLHRLNLWETQHGFHPSGRFSKTFGTCRLPVAGGSSAQKLLRDVEQRIVKPYQEMSEDRRRVSIETKILFLFWILLIYKSSQEVPKILADIYRFYIYRWYSGLEIHGRNLSASWLAQTEAGSELNKSK